MAAPNCLDSICASLLRYLRKIVIDYSISEINSGGNSGHWDGLGSQYLPHLPMQFWFFVSYSKGLLSFSSHICTLNEKFNSTPTYLFLFKTRHFHWPMHATRLRMKSLRCFRLTRATINATLLVERVSTSRRISCSFRNLNQTFRRDEESGGK